MTGSLSIAQTVIGGGYAYLLDAKDRRVLRVALAGGGVAETVFEEGKLAGAVVPARPARDRLVRTDAQPAHPR